MKTIALVALVALAHILFVFVAYGTGFFGLGKDLPYGLVIGLRLGASSVVAGIGYFAIGSYSKWEPLRALAVPFALTAVAASLYLGVYLSIFRYGSWN